MSAVTSRLPVTCGMICWVNKHTQIRVCALLLPPPRAGLTGTRAYSWRKAEDTPHRSRTAYYDILKVSPNATHAQIKSAYYKQSFAHHPDRNRSEDAPRIFALVSEAYSVLGDSGLRRKYDRGILSHTDVQAAGRPASKTRRAPSSGRSAHFDFDAFYQAHYGEQLQREQEMKLRREQAQQLQREKMRRWREEKATQIVTFLLCCGAIIVILRI